MSDAQILIENVLNALAAGITIGCIYGLMCVGLGLIFGIMRVVNFAQGELLMLGMYVSLYLVTGCGVLAFLGPYVGAVRRRAARRPGLFVGGALLHRFLIARVSGLRTAGSLDEGHFGQIIVTLGMSLILQNGGLIVFGSTPRSGAHAAVVARFGIGPIDRRRHAVPQQGARWSPALVAIVVGARALSAAGAHPARQGAARRGRQPDGGDLHGHRRRPRLSASRSASAAASPRSPAG